MSAVESTSNNSAYIDAVDELRGNDGQWAAFNSTGHTVVLAGPGSGKTKTLTVKMAKMLIEDVREPRKIACLTYSNQCARELEKRLSKLGIEDGKRTFIGTVHSFCLQEIIIPYAKLAGVHLPEPLNVATFQQQDEFLAKAISLIKPDDNPSWHESPFADFRKTVIFRDSSDWLDNDFYRPMVEAYEKRLLEAGLIDFDGMVLTAVHLIRNNLWIRKALKAKYPVLIIDEYQDLGVPLHQMVLDLCIDYGIRLFAVGDPDQSIYGFTGARPNLLNELAIHEQINKIELSLNYRCGKRIIEASSVMLDREAGYESATNHEGLIYQYECPQGFGEQLATIFNKIVPAVLSEGTSLGKIGILYYGKNDGQFIANAAKSADIDYIRFDTGNPYRRTPITAWLEDCALWCAGGWKTGNPKLSQLIFTWLRFNPSLTTDAQIWDYKRRLVKFLFDNRDSSIMLRQWLENSLKVKLFENLKDEPLYSDGYESLRELYNAINVGAVYEKFTVGSFSGQNGSTTHLNLSTMHSAKGLEYDIVILPGLEEGKMPYTYNQTPQQIEEKRRLFYVSLTRAKKEVHLLYSGFTVNQYGKRFPNGKSRFIVEIDKRMDMDS